MSRTERRRKIKIGTEVAHVTCDSDTTFKVKRSKVKVTRPLYSSRRLHIRQLQRWAWESIHRGNILLRCRLQARRSARRREALRRPQREERGGGHIVSAARLQLVSQVLIFYVRYEYFVLIGVWVISDFTSAVCTFRLWHCLQFAVCLQVCYDVHVTIMSIEVN